ncbi:LCP family protein [Streptomyces caatingaensis]|uniref:Transcriptional regulator n=1 Tax=Streptomyces caatingaensis TaxID=1678637 RepID=A0A0K9XBF5_9ACTN|nr:LCP family protein [Streptomyces caatingaensis]KNB50730.1 transcriptional regulator [Streptomyces caatingaensis]
MTRTPVAERRDGRRAARIRRRRRGRARLIGAIAGSCALLLVGGAAWLYCELDGSIDSFDAKGLAKDRPAEGSGGQNVLVIGSDSRAGANSSLGGGEGEAGRSDTAFLLHVHGDRKHAVAVSIPRDTLVDIPPCRLPDGRWTEPRTGAMFNSAFSVGLTPQGNPACTQNTVEKLTGLRVDHTVVVDFAGFSAMTSAVGGVRVCLPHDVHEGDLNPHRGSRGARIFAKGPQTVSGQKALDYVRLRHGIGDGSDIGRIKRQQAFVSSLVKKIKDEGFDPATLLPLAQAATKSMTVDPGLGSARKLLSFAMSLKDVDLHDTKFVTLPWRYQGNRVAVVHPDADALWEALRNDRTIDGHDAGGRRPATPGTEPAPTPPSGAGISVAVHNGTTVEGLAARAAETLRKDGFTVTATTTVPATGHSATLVTYGPGLRSRAETVARRFPGAELRQTAAGGIGVTLGTAYAAGPSPAPSSPAPTAVPSRVAEQARSADDDVCSDLSYG